MTVENRLRSQLPAASDLARMCLDQLVADPESLGRFMADAGYDPASLRSALGSPELEAGLIDHFGRNEPLLLALCEANTLRPEEFMAVWHRLNPGT